MKNIFLVVVLGLALLLKIPSWFEPYWYGDEAIYLTIGQSLNRGVQLYGQIHDNKPPLLYVIAAIATGRLFWFKVIATYWGLITTVVLYKLAKKIFSPNLNGAKWATGLFVLLISLPWLEGNIANAELFFLLPTIMAVYLLWSENLREKTIFWAGVCLGIGGLFKVPAMLEFGIWPVLWWIFEKKKAVKNTLVLGSGVVAPILISMVYFWLNGTGRDYINAVWRQNLPYVTSWGGGKTGISLDTLSGRAGLLILMIGMGLVLAKKAGRTATTIWLWFSWTWFAAMLSGRPYPHYLLQMTGVLTIIPGFFWYGKATQKIMAVSLVCGFILTMWWFKFYTYPTKEYYINFVRWGLKLESRQAYFSRFSSGINSDYEVASRIISLTNSQDKIFVWGDEPALYALSGREPLGKYTVKYHIKELHQEINTITQLYSNPPKVIVSMGDEISLPGFSGWLNEHYVLVGVWGARKVYHLQI